MADYEPSTRMFMPSHWHVPVVAYSSDFFCGLRFGTPFGTLGTLACELECVPKLQYHLTPALASLTGVSCDYSTLLRRSPVVVILHRQGEGRDDCQTTAICRNVRRVPNPVPCSAQGSGVHR